MGDIEYMMTKIDQLSVEMALQANGITFEKSQMYGDFVMYLINKCFDTYPGDDIMDEVNKSKHFDWCFDKTKNVFIKYNLYVSDKLYSFMKDFIFDLYYNNEDKVLAKDTTTAFFQDLFNHRQPKTMADLDCFVGVYSIFESNER